MIESKWRQVKNHFNYPDELMKPDSHILSWQQSALAASFTNHRFLSEFNKVNKANCISPENLTQNGSSDMDHSHVNGAINLTTITSSTSPSESPNETPTYQPDYEPRTEEQSAALERALKDRQIELEETWQRLNDQHSESDLDLDISTNNNNNKYNLLDDNKHQEHCDEGTRTSSAQNNYADGTGVEPPQNSSQPLQSNHLSGQQQLSESHSRSSENHPYDAHTLHNNSRTPSPTSHTNHTRRSRSRTPLMTPINNTAPNPSSIAANSQSSNQNQLNSKSNSPLSPVHNLHPTSPAAYQLSQKQQAQMQQLLQQHVFSPNQLQQLMKHHSFYIQQHHHQQQHHRQSPFELTRKQLEQNMQHLQEQLQMNLLQQQSQQLIQSGDDHHKKKSQNSSSQMQQQLTLQQQELIQQLQIIQRQYLMHQGIGLSPLLLAQQQQQGLLQRDSQSPLNGQHLYNGSHNPLASSSTPNHGETNDKRSSAPSDHPSDTNNGTTTPTHRNSHQMQALSGGSNSAMPNSHYQPINNYSSTFNTSSPDKYANLLNSIVLSRRDELNNMLMVSGSQNSFEERNDDKSGHPLFDHGVCKWPGCEMVLDDIPMFIKHLNAEHCLDDRTTAQARVQMQVVSQLEIHLQKERDRLQAMMHHLYLAKQKTPNADSGKGENKSLLPQNSGQYLPSPPTIQVPNSMSSVPIRSPMLNSPNIGPVRRRITDKSTLSLAGEIQRNREFYKNADVRPPFTYASLIRQSIIESPDKQLTLNEIYNWFQNTFCYFRRNAATWKNAIRTNLSLHKCFVRYEDDFGSFWMVDDNEFVKRRHLSRGRPRKYDPSPSPTAPNQQQNNNYFASNLPSQGMQNSMHSPNMYGNESMHANLQNFWACPPSLLDDGFMANHHFLRQEKLGCQSASPASSPSHTSRFDFLSLNGSNPVKIENDPNENSHHNVTNLIKREQTTEHLECDRDYEQTSGITGDVRAEDLSMPEHVSSHIMDS
ncbi:forkhead box protein P1 isoform X3 [Bradysia coprophila]|uniref:forkhead box protein P1 isoform X3 n=1 Tax=Bradysia coprophila TaxID=38358 RepID=UPI00187DB80B|nr:forkhead box protein P1 isoform X3 [Bradysia coprophila]